MHLNEKPNGYIRLIVTRGTGTLGLDPRKCDSQVIVIVDDIALYPPELYDNGLEIITAARESSATGKRIALASSFKWPVIS